MAARVFAICAFLIGLAAIARPALAQEAAPGALVITVTDAVTHAPIDNADVFLLGGATPVSDLTDEHGQVIFEQLAIGTYAVTVEDDGYHRVDVNDVEILEGMRSKVAIALEPSLRTIAVVTARPSVSISSESINADSATRMIAQSLKNALSMLAGVSVDDTTYGPDSGFSVSLENHDASQTATSINGIRISGPASSLLGGGGNLFGGAEVNFAPTAGYLGGTINFQTILPSKLWTYNLDNEIGNYGAQTESQSATGSEGKFAFGLQHDYTSRDANLSGLTYADQSGEDYLHLAGNRGTANLVTADYKMSPRVSLSATGIFENANYSTICSTFTTLVPCGYGPGGSNESFGDFLSYRATFMIGNVAFNVFDAQNLSHEADNDVTRTLDGIVDPYRSQYRSTGDNYGGFASVTSRRHSYSLRMQGGGFGGTFLTTYNGIPTQTAQPRQSSTDIDLSDRVKSNDWFGLTHSLSFASATGSGSAVVLSETADWKPTQNDSYEASLGVGSAQPTYSVQLPIGDPLSAQYDCYNGSVFLTGPSDPAVRQSSITYSLSWRHSYDRGAGGFDVSLYRQNAFGQQFYGAVPIGAEPSALFPGGLNAYLGAIQSVWSAPTECGTIPFSPDRTYVNQTLTGMGQVYQGVRAQGRIPLGNNVIAYPTYTYGGAYLSSLDPRLAATGSFYAVGEQLPRQPPTTAGLSVDEVMPRAHLEWVTNAEFTGSNNQFNLPAFTIYTAGVVYTTSTGTITLSETNIFGSHAGLFTTYQDADPMPVVGGGTFAYASNPVPPRQWIFSWRIRWSQHRPRPAIPSVLPSPTPKPTATPSAR